MITYTHQLAGDTVEIHALDPGDDETPVLEFIRRRNILALDVETTGLDIYGGDFRLRLAQISDGREAWVLRCDTEARDIVEYAAWVTPGLIVHNAPYDLAVIDHMLGVPMEHTFPNTVDTQILSRIVDPLGDPARQGGKLMPRHGLKHLARKHVDPDLDTDRALSDRLRSLKLPPKSAGGFAQIDSLDPVYVTYAGLDAIVTYRVCEKLVPELTSDLRPLFDYETQLAGLLAQIQRRGVLVDVDYTQVALARLRTQWETSFETVAAYGLTSTDLNTGAERERFAQLLREQGVKVGKTKTGQPALSKTALADALTDSPASELAEAFFRCRELEKHGRDYLHKFLDMRDESDRLHPSIHSLGAQTGRMSISDPPLQQIPREDDVRSCLVAEPGHVLVAADYRQIEFRVAAALADEPTMKKAIVDGVDLHDVTARRLFGDDFTDEQRTIAKRAGFGRLYGAGSKAVAQQCGVTVNQAKQAIAAFDNEYPGIAAYAEASAKKDVIVTRLGRRLPLDSERSYIGVNYAIQSEARDVFAQGMLRLAEAGFREHLFLPVHDEVIVSVPQEDADAAARAMETIMLDELDGVPITANAKILGHRWCK